MFKDSRLDRYTVMFRVLDKKTRNGAYRSSLGSTLLPRGSNDENKHPAPYDDRELRAWWGNASSSKTEEFYFGFTGCKQLYSWFHEFDNYNAARLKDGVIGCFLVPKKQMHIGACQMIARRSRMILIEDVTLKPEYTDEFLFDKLEQKALTLIEELE